MTIALRAFGCFSSPASFDQLGVVVPLLSSELPLPGLTKPWAGLSHPAVCFGLLDPTSGDGEPRLQRSITELRLGGLGRLGTGEAIAGRGEEEGIVGEMTLKTGAGTTGEVAGEAISPTGD